MLSRELTYLDGSAGGEYMTRVLESGNVVGEFLHSCTALTQIDIVAEAAGNATAGCRCCNECSPGPCMPP